jgi:hypothetical protein
MYLNAFTYRLGKTEKSAMQEFLKEQAVIVEKD